MTGGSARGASPPSQTVRTILVRAAPALALVAVAAMLYGGVAGDISLANLKQHEQDLRAYVVAHPALFVAGYVLLYAVATGSFVPLGMVLMLAAGLLLGPWLGGAAAVAGNTGGALITYFAARFAARGLHERLALDGRFARLAEGFGANAFTYMLTLRLIPLSPFGVVNVAAGVARVPVRAYAAATVLGSIPIALIYTHLGAGLGEAFASGREADLSILRDPRVLIPFLCLAGLSLAAAIIGRKASR